ncbi:MAG TPA: DUF1192 domain-containing protein [Rhizomicrobium sp.]
MPIDPDELLPRKKKLTELMLGEDLSAMSEHELVGRIAAIEGEISRCRDAINVRRSTKSAAEGFFRKA